ncbi:MAG: hypothetical protein K2N56_13275 [Oscillospiraceae bacterium]|nr:hypothetical protein [Oscillospiraceae bacterium]
MKIPLKVKLLAVFGNALICPIGFILAAFFLYLIPPLGSIYLIWLGLIITALPQAVIALRLQRRINDEYELGARKYVCLCALPAFLISLAIFLLMVLSDSINKGMDINGLTVAVFFAVIYALDCCLVISAALWIRHLIERRKA